MSLLTQLKGVSARDRKMIEEAETMMGPEPEEMGFIKNLFWGRVRDELLFPYPVVSPEEKAKADALVEELEAYMKNEHPRVQVDAEQRIPDWAIRRLFDMEPGELRSMSAEETAGTGRFSFVPIGDVELELIELLDANVTALCGDPAPGISHIALQVEDIEGLVASLAQRGFRLGYITKQGIFDSGRSKEAYLDPEDTQGYLVELVEPRS